MATSDRVPNDALVSAGLNLMRQAGKSLERVPTKGRSMIYKTASGETVRVRTCNDHLLVVLADRDEEGAKLNVEGTDHILIVMPEVPRSHGTVAAYLVPADEVIRAARTTHREWLATKPNTKGDNRTWNIWFDEDGPAKANGFAKKWGQYRLPGIATTTTESSELSVTPSTKPELGDVVAAAARQIAEVAGVSPDAVKITVELT